MLVRLLYASRAADAVDAAALSAILASAREHNARDGITGVLCCCLDERVFVQVLEGGRSAVNATYHRIARDPRHRGLELLAYDEIGERHFASWSMGQVNMGRLNPAAVLKYFESSAFDPYAVSGQATLALFYELVATASVAAQGSLGPT